MDYWTLDGDLSTAIVQLIEINCAQEILKCIHEGNFPQKIIKVLKEKKDLPSLTSLLIYFLGWLCLLSYHSHQWDLSCNLTGPNRKTKAPFCWQWNCLNRCDVDFAVAHRFEKISSCTVFGNFRCNLHKHLCMKSHRVLKYFLSHPTKTGKQQVRSMK